jgi:hypothetical protein
LIQRAIFDMMNAVGGNVMKRKILCRVIDSIPLPTDGADLHLGWAFDTGMYSVNDSSKKTRRNHSADSTAHIYLEYKKNTLDYYA